MCRFRGSQLLRLSKCQGVGSRSRTTGMFMANRCDEAALRNFDQATAMLLEITPL